MGMCGIVGIATTRGRTPSLGVDALQAMRDRLAHRGPDDAGLMDRGHVLFGHRRLAVRDLSAAGHQPMASACGRYALVYNGEIYNDAELRAELIAAGVRFTSRCDTETLLHALMAWGAAGPAAGGVLGKVRGMFALAFVDFERNRLLLARDPLGIKPLYYELAAMPGATDQHELTFASEISAVASRPDHARRPDLAVVSAYLTTIRTTLDDRTLFAGVRQVRPGECLIFDLSRPDLACTRSTIRWQDPGVHTALDEQDEQAILGRVRHEVEGSIRRHAISDAPLCAMLSGGLDSAIVCTLLARERADPAAAPLHTFCAFDPGTADEAGDAHFARVLAQRLGTHHHEVRIDRALFNDRWRQLVAHNGAPLSTPNEIAIDEIARTMREHGLTVALSGEGADELFGGYGSVLRDAEAFETGGSTARSRAERVRFLLDTSAWISLATKPGVLRPECWHSIEHDHALLEAYERELRQAEAEASDADPLQLHLGMQRRINLQGLLQRLDACTMRHSIEGRTPFADARIASLATGLPMRCKYVAPDSTKIALRQAFGADLPPEVVRRPKASFPLPFQSWLQNANSLDALRSSPLIRELFTPTAIEAVATRPSDLWPLAWPMLNLAIWDQAIRR